jgi:gliding motility-associated lipoprotein GldD
MIRLVFVFFVIFVVACNSAEQYVPKPHAYPRMIFQKPVYKSIDSQVKYALPYSFEIPQYALLEKDTIGNLTPDKNWFNLNFKPFGATLHITYYHFKSLDLFDSLIADSRKLVNKHMQKADDIIEEAVTTDRANVRGVQFNIEGNTATNLNFYLTDSAHNFFRGALYFNHHTQSDSIQPVYEFIKNDVKHLIKTFHWK